MASFKQGELHLLVATTVIEVGVDVPNASLMIIENPERLGLAQLHQLRGRVGRGRGAVASHCVLLYKTPLSKTAQIRLQVLRDSNDGFVIAQKDLEIRGPGELLGTRQTGNAEFKVADLLRDQAMIPEVQRLAPYSRTLPTTGKSPDRTLDAGDGTLLECVKAAVRRPPFQVTLPSCRMRFRGPAIPTKIKFNKLMNQCAALISEAYQAFVFVAAAILPPLHRLSKNRQHQIQLNHQRIDDIDKERTDHRHHQNAMCDGPKRSVIACMLAIAVGVAPRPKPQ